LVLAAVPFSRAVPQVGNVALAQRSHTRTLDITYTLSGEAAIVTLSITTNGVALPDRAVTALSGDVCKRVEPGTRSIVWQAGQDWPEHLASDAKAVVTAWATNNPPLYLVADLSEGASATNYPVCYYTSADALPAGGLTNPLYRTSWLVLRRIRTQSAYPENGVFEMGSPITERGHNEIRWSIGYEDQHLVTLTHDFYLGVFEVTQGQWHQVMGTVNGGFSCEADRLQRPVEQVAYNAVRGNGWPESGASNGTFFKLLQQKTGLAAFDLPTEAQWEYACRAGTATSLYSGGTLHAIAGADTNVTALGRYRYNGGALSVGSDQIEGAWQDPATDAPACPATNGTAVAGSYLPNAWGLYDMLGNVYEFCLDWMNARLGVQAVLDPTGPATANRESGNRVTKGGSYGDHPFCLRAGFRRGWDENSAHVAFGFRAAMNLPTDMAE